MLTSDPLNTHTRTAHLQFQYHIFFSTQNRNSVDSCSFHLHYYIIMAHECACQLVQCRRRRRHRNRENIF